MKLHKNFAFCEMKNGTKLKYDDSVLNSDSSVTITLATQQVKTGHGGRCSGVGRKPEAVDDEGKTERKNQSMYCTDREIQFLREVLKQRPVGQNDMTLFQIFEKTFYCGSCSENNLCATGHKAPNKN